MSTANSRSGPRMRSAILHAPMYTGPRGGSDQATATEAGTMSRAARRNVGVFNRLANTPGIRAANRMNAGNPTYKKRGIPNMKLSAQYDAYPTHNAPLIP